MPELGELIAIEIAKDTVDQCPFEHEDRKHTETNDLSNVARTLGSAMQPAPQMTLSFSVGKRTYSGLPLKFNPHHLIPGGSIKNAAGLLPYMKKSDGKIKGDIGYDQNDSRNGEWLPSYYGWSSWSSADFLTKFSYAYWAMVTTGKQFHLWEGSDGSHKDYNDWVRRTLGKMQVKMMALKDDCKKCSDEEPFNPPYKLVDMLYDLADRCRKLLTRPLSKWAPPLCTSDYAVLVGAGKTPESMTRLQQIAE